MSVPFCGLKEASPSPTCFTEECDRAVVLERRQMDTILFRSEKLCRTCNRTPMHNWEDMLKEAILTVNASHSFNIIASTLNSIAWSEY